MKIFAITLAALLFLIGCVYLLLPSPTVPDLENSVRSDESGDTWQHPDQKAFYTNRVRQDVISEMQTKFSTSFFNIRIPSFRLNYRPEESFEFIRDQVPSYYLEEILFPFRDSLFVNGWEPTNSPAVKPIPGIGKPPLYFKDQIYLSKVTLRPVSSSPWARLLVWALIFPSSYITYLSLKRSISA